MRRPWLAVIAAFLCAASLAAQTSGRRRAVGSPPPTLGQWIVARGIPFATVEPVDDDSDLLPLRAIVGDAAYVGVGEATHGSHEFFAMKHRLFRFLAERMGFTVFSIEASLPECDKINDFVQSGAGDPSALVAGMHFWTWNVDEVLDLVLWMRAYNVAHPDRPQLSYRGFDMQFSQMAVADLTSYLRRVDAANANAIASRLACINVTYSQYDNLLPAPQNACRTNVTAVYDGVAAARTRYIAASSEEEYERMLRYARVIVQFEDTVARGGSGARDRYMAENAEWIAETAHPGEKMMLWAHNYHISDFEGAASMGGYLRVHWSSGYLRMGFLFDSGDFNAVDGTTRRLQVEHVAPGPDDGFEKFFRDTGQPRLIIDLRNPPANIAADLAAPRSQWQIGALFPVPRETLNFSHDFDVAIWVAQSTPSRLRQ